MPQDTENNLLVGNMQPPETTPASTPAPAPVSSPTPVPAANPLPTQPSVNDNHNQSPATIPPELPVSAPEDNNNQSPAPIEQPPDSFFSKFLQFKKYIVAILAGIVFVAVIYAAYGFFFKSENTTGLPTELDNNLSENAAESTNSSTETETPDPSDLERVVNELKEQPTETEDSSVPPGIDIVIPEDTMMTPFLPPASSDPGSDSAPDSTDSAINSDTSAVVPR